MTHDGWTVTKAVVVATRLHDGWTVTKAVVVATRLHDDGWTVTLGVLVARLHDGWTVPVLVTTAACNYIHFDIIGAVSSLHSYHPRLHNPLVVFASKTMLQIQQSC